MRITKLLPSRWLFIARLFLISFALNWAWEMSQMIVYSGFQNRSMLQRILICTVATFGDAFLTLGIYTIARFIARLSRRETKNAWKLYAAAMLLGAACAVIIERIALLSGHWFYTNQMPSVPLLGVGLWPFLQLALLVPLAVWIALKWNTLRSASHRAATANSTRDRLITLAIAALVVVQQDVLIVNAQNVASAPEKSAVTMVNENGADRKQAWTDTGATLTKYIDPVGGLSADDAVAYALAHNGELLAARQEIEAARGLIRQAGLRPNPKLNLQRREQIGGADNDTMIGGSLPLELGGRRAARVLVAHRGLELREHLLADRERTTAAEVRDKFGEVLAAALKLGFTEDLLNTTRRGYKLVLARVIEGRTAPLEQNMTLVEVNRIRSMRETAEGKVEVSLLELRNIIGMPPEEPLRLRGNFDDLLNPLPPLSEATARALQERPDLLAARANENLAEAQIEQARAGGRLDAELTGQYERNNFSFSQRGINSAGQLVPIQGIFHSVAVGIAFDLPVRNKNQGAIEAAAAEAEAAKQRREYAELTVRREIAAAYVKYERAARAMEIYRVGVRSQADANLNVVRQTYELGAKTLLDYINEQRRFIELENDYINAQLETYSASVEIKRATAAVELIKR